MITARPRYGSGVDVIGSGPERPPRAPVGSALRATARRRLRADSRRARLAGIVAGVLVAATAMLALRAGMQPDAEPTATAATPIATPNMYARAYLEDPPFDRLPGRTPIPDPAISLDHRSVQGPLPAVGDRSPGPVTAGLAGRLVLGRYCRHPHSVDLSVRPLAADWTRVRAHAERFDLAVDVYLTWDAATGAYAWTGTTAQLGACS